MSSVDSQAIVAAESAFPPALTTSGAAMTIHLQRMGGDAMELAIEQSATVHELKEALRCKMSLGVFGCRLATETGKILEEDSKSLEEYGVVNDSLLMVLTESARDYSRISGFENVIDVKRKHPSGILITDKGDVLVTSYYGWMEVYDSAYDKVKEYRLPGEDPSQMALALNGELLVVFMRVPHQVGTFDFENVELRSDTLTHRRWIGADAKLQGPEGLALHGDCIFVSDGRAGTLSVFSHEAGNLLQVIQNFSRPQGLCIVEDSFLAVTERGANRVQLLSLEDLQPVCQIPPAESRSEEAQLSQPNDVAVDSAGNLLVMDTYKERIAVFRSTGTFVASVLPGFFVRHFDTHSFIACNLASGAIAASNDDEHKIMVLSPIFELPGDA